MTPEEFRCRRIESGISQAAIASAADVDPSYVGRFERRERSLPIGTQQRLEQALDSLIEKRRADGNLLAVGRAFVGAIREVMHSHISRTTSGGSDSQLTRCRATDHRGSIQDPGSSDNGR